MTILLLSLILAGVIFLVVDRFRCQQPPKIVTKVVERRTQPIVEEILSESESEDEFGVLSGGILERLEAERDEETAEEREWREEQRAQRRWIGANQ